MHANIHDRAKRRNVRDNAGQLHAGFQILHFLHAALEGKYFKLLARIAAGFRELAKNVGQRRQAHGFGDVFRQLNLLPQTCIAHQVADGAIQILRHAIHQLVTFWMHRTRIERRSPVAKAEKTGGLFKRFFAKARNFF